MMIVGQHLGQAVVRHGHHGAAVGHTILLVRPRLVQGQSGVEIGTGLGKHVHVRITAHSMDKDRDVGPPIWAKTGKIAQDFGEDLAVVTRRTGPSVRLNDTAAAWKASRGKISAIQ